MPGVVMRTVAVSSRYGSPQARQASTDEMRLPPKTYYRTATVGGHAIFYREAGDQARPTIVLLHGFPSTSHEFRELIPLLSQDYHVVAPDYLGSGYSDHPDPNVQPYTFDRLADAMQDFLDVLGLKRYTLYMTDFGDPVGFRLMERDPEAVEAIIVQNANCYLEGLTPARQTYFRRAHDDRSPEGVAFVYDRTGADSIINQQYLRDVPPERREIMNPDSWGAISAFSRPKKTGRSRFSCFRTIRTISIVTPPGRRYCANTSFRRSSCGARTTGASSPRALRPICAIFRMPSCT